MARQPASFHAHPMWRSATYFSFGVGAVIVVIWLWRLISGELTPEFQTDPLAVWTRLIAELATAAAMLLAGYGLVTGASWVRKFYLVATGMLIFSGVTSLGHYMGSGQTWIVILYLAFAVMAFAFVLRVEE